MATTKLTDKAVQNFKPPSREVQQQDHWDKLLPAFGLRIGYGGSKTWVVALRVGKGTPLRRRALGRYPAMTLEDARIKARNWLALAAAGVDPETVAEAERAELAENSANTFEVMAARFITEYVERKKRSPGTLADYKRILQGERTAHWRKRPVIGITGREVDSLIESIHDGGSPVAANRTLAYLRKFFRWCRAKQVITVVPTEGLEPPGEEGEGRALKDSEIPEVWRAIDAESGVFAPLLKILLLTGQRRGEVGGMAWDELTGLQRDDEGHLVPIDGQKPAWEIPGTRTKNKLPNVVPLTPQAIALLNAVTPKAGSKLVFTTNGEKAYSGFSNVKERVDKHIAAARAKAKRDPIEHWTFHSFRHTVSTGMNEIGVLPHIVEAVLNHISGAKAGVAGRYNKAAYLDEKRKALEAWAEHVDKLLKPPAVLRLAAAS